MTFYVFIYFFYYLAIYTQKFLYKNILTSKHMSHKTRLVNNKKDFYSSLPTTKSLFELLIFRSSILFIKSLLVYILFSGSKKTFI